MADAVIQFQILSTVPDETAEFYSTLFGWSVNNDNPMGYREIRTGATEGIHGGIWPAPPQATNFVQLFMAVDDVEKSAKRAEELGAKMLIPPTSLPDGSEMAVLHDPQGMSFGIVRRV